MTFGAAVAMTVALTVSSTVAPTVTLIATLTATFVVSEEFTTGRDGTVKVTTGGAVLTGRDGATGSF